MAREPGELERWSAGFHASERLGESEDFKPNPVRIGENELVLALVFIPIPFTGHAVVAPSAEPIRLDVAPGGGWEGYRIGRAPGWRRRRATCSR